MQHTNSSYKFFVAGGALRADAPSYVERPADLELRKHIEAGELCYVLTTRQMGKSSLMARTAADLRAEGFHTAIVDLTSIGQAPAGKWYLSFLDELGSQLPMTSDVEAWWEGNKALSHARRFTKFFQDVVSREVDGRVVIFVDEIDSVLNLDFADDFFAAIRALYNRDSIFQRDRRLSFVLLGVAAPNDLIKDKDRTPFNIGTRIDLKELTLKDAEVLLQGLPERNRAILERIFHWASGHPYLTQRIGEAIARDSNRQWSDTAVDEVVSSLFFTDEAVAQESNLQFVGRRVTSSPNKEELLRLYRDVYHGKPVKSIEQSPFQNELKLFGLVHTGKEGLLEIRNRIYKEVFDQRWIRENTTQNTLQQVAVAAIVIMSVALLAFAYYWQQRPKPDEILAQSYTAAFQETANPTLRLSNLANLVALEGYSDDALDLFSGLSTDEQVALFESVTPDLWPQAKQVVGNLYTALYADDFQATSIDTTRVLEAMADALNQSDDAESRALRDEIGIWLRGRSYAEEKNLSSALVAYDLAIELNEANPATRIERALVLTTGGEYEDALSDLAVAWEQGPPWDGFVIDTVNREWGLHLAALDSPVPPRFVTFLATPTLDDRGSIQTAGIAPGQIAFSSNRDGNEEIYLMNSDGAQLIRLTNDPARDWAPAWSPNGSRIVFTSDRDGDNELYIMNADGTNPIQLTHNERFDCCGDWSPDGTKIVFHGQSPQGDQDIFVIDIASTNLVNLTNFPGDDMNPRWSPDGTEIVFDARRDGQAELYKMDAGGSNVRRLTTHFSAQRGASWSPDGRYLMYYSNQVDATSDQQGDENLFIMDRDGSNQVAVIDTDANEMWPAWSNNGEWILFTAYRDGNAEIYIANRDGTSVWQLTDHPAEDSGGQWRPSAAPQAPFLTEQMATPLPVVASPSSLAIPTQSSDPGQ